MDQAPPPLEARPGLYWAPIRHHSPQCGWQLRRLIEILRPDRILVEGPSEANHLLPFLQDQQARPPLAVYLYALDPAARSVQGEARHYRAFVPLAAMSPEWIALQTAAALGVAVHFIDLPYARRLPLLEQPLEHHRADEELLNDDRLIAGAKPMQVLLQRSGCRDFDQWWERHFESGTTYASAEAFFTQLLRLGLLLRQGDCTQDPETLAREAWMADQVRPHLAAGERCLLVCGAYHCAGILHYLDAPQPSPPPPKLDTGAHLVPYSLERLNRAAGYAAGMSDCGYYAAVWNKLSRRKQPGEPFREVNAELAAALAGHLRELGYAVTLPDAIEANAMAQRLAELRGHRVGRAELREAIDSCFLKQARDGSESAFQQRVNRFLAGDASGRLPGQVPLSPLVLDFRRQARRFRWSLSAAEIGEKRLDLYRSTGHREQSRCLHQLAFLAVPYASLLAGPRFAAGEDLQRVREIWQLRWQPESEARLTECTFYGGNLADAALHCLLERLRDPTNRGPQQVALLIEALAMGLHDALDPVLKAVRLWLGGETELLPLCQGLHQLSLAYFARSALAGQGLPSLEQLLGACFERICVRLPWMGMLGEEESGALCDALAGMHGLTVSAAPGCAAELFHDALQALLQRDAPPPLLGAACGILWEVERLVPAQVAQVFDTIFAAASLTPDSGGQFMCGFLRVARGRLGREPQLLELITARLLAWDETEFLDALPSLRQAFTQLSPRETRELAQQLSANPAQAESLLRGAPLGTEDLSQAAALRERLQQASRLWGVTAPC